MTDLLTRSQVDTLAGQLAVPRESLAHLERLGPEQLARLNKSVSDALFDRLAPVFATISKLAPLMPNPLVAKLSQAIIPPVVAGRAAGALGVAHPGRVAGVLSLLTPAYMAACAPYLDPRVIAVLAPVVPPDLLVPAANLLLSQKEYAAAARFLEYSTPELVAALERGITDDDGLLRTAALTPWAERLCQIIRALPEARIDRILRSAATDPEACLIGLGLLARLDPELQSGLATHLFSSLDDKAMTTPIEVALANDVTDELLTIARHLPPTLVAQLAAHEALPDSPVRDALLAMARGDDNVATQA